MGPGEGEGEGDGKSEDDGAHAPPAHHPPPAHYPTILPSQMFGSIYKGDVVISAMEARKRGLRTREAFDKIEKVGLVAGGPVG